MNDPFQIYLQKFQETPIEDKTEHTDRSALEELLNAFADEGIHIQHEPKKKENSAPDFKVTHSESIIGYVENKKVTENLDNVIKSEQIKKYQNLSNNILLTNYIEWVWLHDDQIQRETLCYLTDLEHPSFKPNPEKAEGVKNIICNFFSVAPKGIGRADELAKALAVRSHALRDFLHEELERQEKDNRQGKLFGLYESLRINIFHELGLDDFADAFSQMLTYGLFLAKLNTEDQQITLFNADQFIPSNFEVIRELIEFIKVLQTRERYADVRWIVEEILNIMNHLDLVEIHEDLSFDKKGQLRLFKTEEDKLLFQKDPYVYFYEDYLKYFDKKTKKARGVYYTPPPVVNFIIRAIDDILRNDFNISKGLADRDRVTILDFATGTGTFLLEIIERILDQTSEGKRDLVIREHILKNLFGFEYLIAPYTIAHLKLSQYLHDKGYTMQPKERLQIYLTNTLEPVVPQANYLLPALATEGKKAQEIKERKILVITGNPPYSDKSKNNGDWIQKLLRGRDTSKSIEEKTFENYYKVDDMPLGEKNPRLQDDFIKFLRYAQWEMEKQDEGIVAVITNHSFIENVTLKGMRQSLLSTFDHLYILDLHGSTKKKEKAQDGSKDDNVFDIEQGVAISILVKKPGLGKKVLKSDLWGKRKQKYIACLENSLDTIDWKELSPVSPDYLFLYQDSELKKEFEKGISLPQIFQEHNSGVKTHRDHFVIDHDEKALQKRIANFRNMELTDEALAEKYNLKSSSGWDLKEKRQALSKDQNYKKAFTKILYRPFDCQAYFHHTDVVDRPRHEVMGHIWNRDNIVLVNGRQFQVIGSDHYDIVSVTEAITDTNYFRRGGIALFPLYLYPSEEKEKESKAQLFDDDSFEGKSRIENFKKEFRDFLDGQYGYHYLPEEILGYIYAILHSPAYCTRYLEFLKTDYPCIPIVNKRQTFESLSALGQELIEAHLLHRIPASPFGNYKSKGHHKVEKPIWAEERLKINKESWFEPVPENVWQYTIGGYQVLEKYLKSRKDRDLSLPEIENIENVIKVLAFTIEQMKKIDSINFLNN